MIVICEECGKKYRVDPSKIKGKAASFKCHICSHVVMVSKARPIPTQSDSEIKKKSATTVDDRMAGTGADTKHIGPTADKAKAGTRHRRKTGGINLRTKMVLLFLLIPLMLMTGVSLVYVWQFETSSRLLVREISKINAQLAEKKIVNLSAATAMLQSRAKALIDKARMIALMMLGATLLLIGIIVFAYAHRLTGKIKSLTEVAERISLGDLEMEIESKSRDEIGELADAIARIQDNFRLSVERLRLRR
jgi:predicted Zn finger-like uncharacterized protein